ncbi:TonB-linked SusC/RagA family outer membrane protein [Pedobacter sp. AK017]|uniref:SusC/RagA family TonB-linked outer membrane protein n=1 Tax=Pedobacter sp. AK017 TaxID=2723073 RepID=UPI00160BA389|nr:SusC/RagA family TonB-linked outer membrane protein [Pedobacter sp. AK017]MBB5438503.1 TonB-linked SusC/RagA family outer membrane protein [Pedobacter sp. AK017]
MRLTTVILIASLMQVSATTLAQRITIKGNPISLKAIFTEIKKQTGFQVLYQSAQLSKAKPVKIALNNVLLEEAMPQILADQQLDFEIEDKTIIIKERSPSLLDKLNSVISNVVRDLTIKGRVTDQDGKPLPNASIRVKGKSAVTNTNQNGEFEIKGVDEDAVLLVSYVGFKTLEIVLKDAVMPLEIKLNVATGELEEVKVVYNTGYQELNKERSTGSFVQIDNKLLNRKVSVNVLDRLDGVTSGLVFNPSPSLNFNEPAISIRTRSTIFSNTQPLIVVDNFPYTGDIGTINPNDIENITVLKDAAAASIWGAYSGNGVIVITTKKGKYNNPLSIAINSNVTVGEKPDLYYQPRLSSSNYIEFEEYLFNTGYYSSLENSALKPVLSPVVELLIKRRDKQLSNQETLNQLDILRNTDTRNDLNNHFYRVSVSQQHSLNFSGGSENQQYFFSAGYDKDLKNVKENEFDRITLNANNTYSLFNKRLELTSGIYFSKNNIQTNGIANIYAPYPYLKLVGDNGKGLSVPIDYRSSYLESLSNTKLLDWYYRPYDEISASDNTNQLTDYRISAGLNFRIIDGLSLKVNYQYNKDISETKMLNGVNSYFSRNQINKFSQVISGGEVTRAIPIGGILDKNNNFFEAQNLRGLLNYEKNWNAKHQLIVVGGMEVNKRDSYGERSRQYGYNEEMEAGVMVNYFADYPTLPLSALGKITNPNLNPTSASYDRNISYFANSAYTYNEKYTLSASIRKDESNLFGVKANQRGVPLWSIGTSWDLSRESFYNLSAIPYLKIRLTTGYNGNLNRSLSAVTTVTNTGVLNAYNAPILFIDNPPNPSLRWERINNTNIAIDFKSKNDRISGTIEYYKKKSRDLIGTSPIDPTTGVVTFTGNTASTEGQGVDFIFHTVNINGAISWNSDFLFSYAKDKVTKYDLKINGISSIVGSGLNPIIGNPVIGVYSYKWAGLDPINGDPQGFLDGRVSKDYSGFSSSTNLDNLNYHGAGRPIIFGAFRNSLIWKQFELSINVKFSFNYFFRKPSISYSQILSGVAEGGNDDLYANRWKMPGDELHTTVPSFVTPSAASNRDQFYQYSEVNIEKGDHIRLQDIKFSYQIPNLKSKLSLVRNILVYGYVNNLGVIWKATNSNFDPDYISELLPRTYAFGVRANF